MARANLLLVDDDPLFGIALRNVLADAGYRTALAQSGAEALEAVKEESFDLALLDVKLPDVSGLDLLKDIYRLRPGCGVIAMTGSPTVDAAAIARQGGVFDFLLKPFPIEKLLARIEDFLAARKPGAGVRDGS